MKKKLFVGILVLTMLVACLSVTALAEGGNPAAVEVEGVTGGGTGEDPWVVTSGEQFMNLLLQIEGDDFDNGPMVYIQLKGNIDTSDYEGEEYGGSSGKYASISYMPVIYAAAQIELVDSASLTMANYLLPIYGLRIVGNGTIKTEADHNIAIWAYDQLQLVSCDLNLDDDLIWLNYPDKEPTGYASLIRDSSVTSSHDVVIQVAHHSTLTLESGSITSTAAAGESIKTGGAVNVVPDTVNSSRVNNPLPKTSVGDGKFIMEDGTVTSNNCAVYVDNKDGNADTVGFTMNGGKIESKNTQQLPAVDLFNCKAVIENGSITATGDAMMVGSSSTVDLNGGTIERTAAQKEDSAEPAVMVLNKSTLNMTSGTIKGTEIGIQVQDSDTKVTVTGGTIESTDPDGAAAVAVTNGSSFEMSAGTITSAGQGLSVGKAKGDGDSAPAKATIKGSAVVNCTEMSGIGEVQVADNGELTIEDNAEIKGGVVVFNQGKLTVKGGTITSESFGISTNGSDSKQSVIEVSGGTVTGGDTACGVYLPAGSLTVKDGTIEGGSGIVVRGGKLDVQGGSITATGSGTITVGDAKDETDRYAIPVAGITVDKHSSYDESWEVKVTGENAVITGNPTIAYTDTGKAGTADEGKIVVSNGTFVGGNVAADIKDFLDEGKIVTVDGKVISGTGTLKIGLADAKDNSDGAIDEPVSNDDIVTTYDAKTNSYNVQITADEVKYHMNDQKEGGYWIGFYIEAPSTEATHVKDSSVEGIQELKEGDPEGAKRYNVYYDLSDGAKTSFTVTFYPDDTGVIPVGRDLYTINLDLTGAKMDDMTLESAGFTYNADNEQLKEANGGTLTNEDCGKETMYVKLSDNVNAGKYIVAVFKDGKYLDSVVTAHSEKAATFLYWSFLNKDQVGDPADGIATGNYTFELYTYTGNYLTDTANVKYENGTLVADGYSFAKLTSKAPTVSVTDKIDDVKVAERDGKPEISVADNEKAVVTADATVNGHEITISGGATALKEGDKIEVTLDLSNETDKTAGTVKVEISKDTDWNNAKVVVKELNGVQVDGENSTFKLLTQGGAFTVKAEIEAVEAEIADGETVVEIKGEMSEDDKSSLTSQTTQIAQNTKTSDDDTTLKDLTTEAVTKPNALPSGDTAKDALTGAEVEVENKTVTIYVQPHLNVDITGYNSSSTEGSTKTFSVEINAVYDVVATTAESADQINLTGDKGSKNAVQIGDPHPLTVNEAIDLEVGLPSNFTQEDNIYVMHTKNGSSHYHKATVAQNVATFTSDDGLSPFVFEAGVTPVAQIGNTFYTTLQDAVNAVKDGGTIKLVGAISEEETEVTVGREVSFTIDATEQTSFDATIIKGGSGYNMGDPAVSGNVYEFTVTRSYTGGGASATTSKVTTPENGSVELSSTTARGGQTVTVTATPDEGYDIGDVIVKDRNGNPVEVTRNDDGTYSYTVPAGKTPVTVEVVFDECLCDDFADLDLDEWYHEAVDYAIKNELMLGQGDGWHPTDAVRGAEIFVILGRLDGAGLETGGDHWYDESLAWAMEKGYTDGSEPLANCSRERAVTLLWRYYGEQASDADITGFVDAADVSDWALDAMKWAVENEIIKGLDNNDIQPKKDLTRAEFATILERLEAAPAEAAE